MDSFINYVKISNYYFFKDIKIYFCMKLFHRVFKRFQEKIPIDITCKQPNNPLQEPKPAQNNPLKLLNPQFIHISLMSTYKLISKQDNHEEEKKDKKQEIYDNLIAHSIDREERD